MYRRVQWTYALAVRGLRWRTCSASATCTRSLSWPVISDRSSVVDEYSCGLAHAARVTSIHRTAARLDLRGANRHPPSGHVASSRIDEAMRREANPSANERVYCSDEDSKRRRLSVAGDAAESGRARWSRPHSCGRAIPSRGSTASEGSFGFEQAVQPLLRAAPLPLRERFNRSSTPATRTERRINRSPRCREKLHRAVDPLLPADSQHPGAVDLPAVSVQQIDDERSIRPELVPAPAQRQIHRVRAPHRGIATAAVALQPAKLVRFITPPASHAYCWSAHHARSSFFAPNRSARAQATAPHSHLTVDHRSDWSRNATLALYVTASPHQVAYAWQRLNSKISRTQRKPMNA